MLYYILTYYVKKKCHLPGNPEWGENCLPSSCILFTYDINKRREIQGVGALIVYSKYTILYTHENCQNVSSFTKDTDFYSLQSDYERFITSLHDNTCILVL